MQIMKIQSYTEYKLRSQKATEKFNYVFIVGKF